MDTTLVFGIIFAIIVIGLLFVFGIEQIGGIFCLGNTAQVDKAVKDLENAVEGVYNLADGSALPFKVAISRNARICLINHSNTVPMNNWNPHPDLYESINYTMYTKRQNVWIEYGCGPDSGYRIRYLRISENFCVGGGTELYLENKGYYVTIERPVAD